MSALNDLLIACQSTIQDLGFTWGPTAQSVQVLVKQQPVARETLESPLPVIVVCPAIQSEEVENAATGGWVGVVYPVDIAVIGPGNSDVASNMPVYLDWREKLRRAFQRVKFSSVPSMWMVEMKTGEIFDRQLARDNYDFLLLTPRFHSFEQASN